LTKPKRVPLGSVLLFVGKVSTPSTRPGLGRGRRRYVIHFIADYREVPDRLQHHDGTYHPAEFRFPEDRLQHTTGSRGRHYRITHSLHLHLGSGEAGALAPHLHRQGWKIAHGWFLLWHRVRTPNDPGHRLYQGDRAGGHNRPAIPRCRARV